jgi:hypothetical protein
MLYFNSTNGFKLVKEERTITNIIKRIDFANFTDLLNCIF